jgi:transcription elongation factor Elf1
MSRKIFKCPHCGDEWEYETIIDHGDNKCLVTKNYEFLEEGQDCVCYKCHNHYRMTITSQPDMIMKDFIYYAWRRCRM